MGRLPLLEAHMREAHDLVPDNLQPPQYGTGH